MRNDKLSVQSMDFAVNIIALTRDLKNQRETIISNQIGRCGTSIGANIREAQYAHGKPDFIAKLLLAGAASEDRISDHGGLSEVGRTVYQPACHADRFHQHSKREYRMNDTKWTEIFKAFYYGAELAGGPEVRWTTRNLDGHEYSDNTWTHFGVGMEYSREIDWLKIDLTPENREFVLETLRKIHVPGEVFQDAVFVYGHRMDVDYI